MEVFFFGSRVLPFISLLSIQVFIALHHTLEVILVVILSYKCYSLQNYM
jgi:hypothetical protein